MTRKEALHVLEQERDYLMGGPFPNFEEFGDALEIAIEVLREQEELESDAPEEGGHPNESSDRLAEAFRKFYSKELIEAVTGLFDRRN